VWLGYGSRGREVKRIVCHTRAWPGEPERWCGTDLAFGPKVVRCRRRKRGGPLGGGLPAIWDVRTLGKRSQMNSPASQSRFGRPAVAIACHDGKCCHFEAPPATQQGKNSSAALPRVRNVPKGRQSPNGSSSASYDWAERKVPYHTNRSGYPGQSRGMANQTSSTSPATTAVPTTHGYHVLAVPASANGSEYPFVIAARADDCFKHKTYTQPALWYTWPAFQAVARTRLTGRSLHFIAFQMTNGKSR